MKFIIDKYFEKNYKKKLFSIMNNNNIIENCFYNLNSVSTQNQISIQDFDQKNFFKNNSVYFIEYHEDIVNKFVDLCKNTNNKCKNISELVKKSSQSNLGYICVETEKLFVLVNCFFIRNKNIRTNFDSNFDFKTYIKCFESYKLYSNIKSQLFFCDKLIKSFSINDDNIADLLRSAMIVQKNLHDVYHFCVLNKFSNSKILFFNDFYGMKNNVKKKSKVLKIKENEKTINMYVAKICQNKNNKINFLKVINLVQPNKISKNCIGDDTFISMNNVSLREDCYDYFKFIEYKETKNINKFCQTNVFKIDEFNFVEIVFQGNFFIGGGDYYMITCTEKVDQNVYNVYVAFHNNYKVFSNKREEEIDFVIFSGKLFDFLQTTNFDEKISSKFAIHNELGPGKIHLTIHKKFAENNEKNLTEKTKIKNYDFYIENKETNLEVFIENLSKKLTQKELTKFLINYLN